MEARAIGQETLERSEPAYYQGSEIREGRLLAQNRGVCVEERYSTAYNLGCGKIRWPDWINVDVDPEYADLVADIRKLPEIESNSADAVAAIHVMEHFYYWEVPEMIQEWKRILKPGGKLILEMPCLDKVLGYIVTCAQKNIPMDPYMTLYSFYGDPGFKNPAMCHKWIWGKKHLEKMLEDQGMKNIQSLPSRYHFAFRDMRFEATK